MNLRTEEIWKEYGTQLHFFVLKRVTDATAVKDVLQNIFLKVHKNLDSLQDPKKVKAWVFQIARNELANHYKGLNSTVSITESDHSGDFVTLGHFCCLERFLEELPENYRTVIHLVYKKGKTNAEAANELGISLPSVKARIRRAKNDLKQRFRECCLYKTNKSGKLVGEPDCAICTL